MKILLLLGSFEKGGAETTAFEFAKNAQQAGHEIFVSALRNRGKMRADYQQAGIETSSELLHFKYDLLAAVRLKKVINNVAPDAIIILDALKNLMSLGGWAIKHASVKCPVLLWLHSVSTGQLGDFSNRLSRAISQNWIDKIICITQQQAKLVSSQNISASKISIIYNGVDFAKFSSDQKLCDVRNQNSVAKISEPFTWVQVANVMPDKDFPTLIKAVEILHAQGENFRVKLVGRGTDSPEIQNMIPDDLPIELLGSRSDIPEILSSADGFVLASKSEVFSVSTLEALASKLPVVVPDIPGFEEMITAGKTGLKPRPENPQSYAQAMQKIMHDENFAAQIAEAGLSVAMKFSSEQMCEKMLSLLAELL